MASDDVFTGSREEHRELLKTYNTSVKKMPGFEDISARLKFSPSDGRIWLDNRRMILLHTGALGALRTELIETLGVRRARALLTRMGYASGAQDAELAAKLRPQASFFDVFAVGPQLHALEGVVQVEPVRLEADVTKGQYYGEFLWKDSSEDEIHIETYGVGADPVCWMQIGYA
ncbi:MAG: AAA family ATPase, partial [Alphaproteobacteria bacterium]